jgi:hypothetical protein
MKDLKTSTDFGNRTATRRARKTGRRCCAPESCGWPSGSLQGLIKPGPLFQEALGLNQEQPEPEPWIIAAEDLARETEWSVCAIS